MLLAWSFQKAGWLGTTQVPIIPGLLTLYFLGVFYSTGWAYGCFRIFTGQRFQFWNFWEGMRYYSLRAVILSALWLGMAILCYWNFRIFPGLIRAWGPVGYVFEGFSFWVVLYLYSMAMYQWPLLFFQDLGVFEVVTKSFFLVLGNSFLSLGLLLGLLILSLLMSTFLVSWFFLGLVFIISLPSVALEKELLKYKITLFNQPLEPLLELFERERKRGWRELLKPWEFQ